MEFKHSKLDCCVVAFHVVIEFFVPIGAHPTLILDKWFYSNILKC
jgi:hypothetical protein